MKQKFFVFISFFFAFKARFKYASLSFVGLNLGRTVDKLVINW